MSARSPGLAGGLCAGVLAGGTGLLLPILLLPDSNLAPILGFILAPPAAILGALLGAAIGKLNCSLFVAVLMGLLVGAIAGGVLIALCSPVDPPERLSVKVFYVLGAALIFGATGAVVRRVSGPGKP